MSMAQSRKSPPKRQCEYCPEQVDPRGYDSHVHFRHAGEVLKRFRENPVVQFYCALEGIGRPQLPPAPDDVVTIFNERNEVEDRLLDRINSYHDFDYLKRLVSLGHAPNDMVADVKRLTRLDEVISIKFPPVWITPVFAQR